MPPAVKTETDNNLLDKNIEKKKNSQLFQDFNQRIMNILTHKDIIYDDDLELSAIPEIPKEAYKKPLEIINQSISKVKETYNEVLNYYNKPSNYLCVGKWVKTVRKEMGLTIKEFSEKTGISHTMILNIESSKLHPSIKNSIKICSVLGIDIQSFTEQVKKETILVFIKSTEIKYSELLSNKK